MVNVAVLGYGTIGSGVVEVLQTNTEVIAQRAGEEIAVKYILDLRDFPGDPNADKIVHDYDIIDKDEDVQVVVECMGGVEPAYTFVKRALLNGRSVATSNKELVAKHGAELIAIAHEKNINFLFEASVGGGIPIIRPLVQCLTADVIEEVPTVCWCGKRAQCNTRYSNGKIVREGAQIMLGSNESYVALCRKHYKEGKLWK